MGTMAWLQAQADPAVPSRSRKFALQVTQNIIREAARGPLGHRDRPARPNRAGLPHQGPRLRSTAI